MKKSLRKFAVAFVVMAAAVGMMGCGSEPNSPEVPVGEKIPEGFVKITGATVSVSIGSGKCPFVNASAGSPVIVNTFYMAETELTYAKWNEVYTWATAADRGDAIYTFADSGRAGKSGGAVTEPVTCVSWRDAIVWCNAASEKEGLTPVYWLEGTTEFTDSTNVLRIAENSGVSANSGKAEKAVININANGYRLPTEAEWEFAARGGDPNAAAWNYSYAGTDSYSELGNYAVFTAGNTANVKSKEKNTAGLYDMSGNVSEWCQDKYSENSVSRLIRGSSWDNNADACVITYRGGKGPEYTVDEIGFRVARNAQ